MEPLAAADGGEPSGEPSASQACGFGEDTVTKSALTPARWRALVLKRKREIAPYFLTLTPLAPPDRSIQVFYVGGHPSSEVWQPVADVVTTCVYLDSDDEAAIEVVLARAGAIREALGYGLEQHVEIERGSIFRTASAWIRAAIRSDEVRDRALKVERAVEIVGLDSPQADVDMKETAAVHQLVASLHTIPRAVVRIGSILLVKYGEPGQETILIRNLSQREVRALERDPRIQLRPESVFVELAKAVEAAERSEPPAESRDATS